jgi:hypothetical protein
MLTTDMKIKYFHVWTNGKVNNWKDSCFFTTPQMNADTDKNGDQREESMKQFPIALTRMERYEYCIYILHQKNIGKCLKSTPLILKRLEMNDAIDEIILLYVCM